MKKHLIALFLIAVMTVSLFGAIDLTATRVQAAPLTVTTIHSPPTVRVRDPYAVYGTVKDSAGNAVTAPGSVALYRAFPGTGWKPWKTVPLTQGTFSTTDSQTNFGYVEYQARWLGTYHGFGASTSYPATTYVRIGTFLSISASRIFGDGNVIDGRLTDQYQHGMSGQPIYVYKRNSATGNQWALLTLTHTTSDGTWIVHDAYQPQVTSYYARFLYTNVWLGTVSLVTPAV